MYILSIVFSDRALFLGRMVLGPYTKCCLRHLNLCFKTRKSNEKMPTSEKVCFVKVPENPTVRQWYKDRLCWWVGNGTPMPEIAFLCSSHFLSDKVRIVNGRVTGVARGTLPLQLDWRTVATAFFGTSDETRWELDPRIIRAADASSGSINPTTSCPPRAAESSTSGQTSSYKVLVKKITGKGFNIKWFEKKGNRYLLMSASSYHLCR